MMGHHQQVGGQEPSSQGQHNWGPTWESGQQQTVHNPQWQYQQPQQQRQLQALNPQSQQDHQRLQSITEMIARNILSQESMSKNPSTSLHTYEQQSRLIGNKGEVWSKSPHYSEPNSWMQLRQAFPEQQRTGNGPLHTDQ